MNNREYKFRAWDKQNKNMKVGTWQGWLYEEIFNNPDFDVMQSTGLKDKNGVLIYEGDIVKVLDRDWSDAEKDTKTLIVYFHHGTFELVSKEGIEELEKEDPDIYNKKWLTARIYKEYGRDRLEIIGNIYEHSNLLK